MGYNPKSFKEIKVGVTETTTVSDIKEGKLSDFVEDLTKWENADPEAASIKVTTKNNAEVIIALPTGEVHPKSKMAKWKAQYGEYPTIGQTVTTIIDASGYKKVVLGQ